MKDLEDRIKGCLFGGAVGDFWGSEYEGRADVSEVTFPRAGFITDDTQLTIATCESILDHGKVEPHHLSRKFLEWFSGGKLTGLGSSTLKALRDLEAGAHWALSGAKGEHAAGNGAAMRIAPIAFMVDPNTESGRTVIRDVCRITHHNDEAYLGALAVAYSLRLLLENPDANGKALMKRIHSLLPDSQVKDRIGILSNLDNPVEEAARLHGSSGHVVESVPLAIYAGMKAGEIGFEMMMIGCIKGGGDTDTVCSIAGQVAGVRTGLARLSDTLLHALASEEDVFRIFPKYAGIAARGL